MTEDRTMADVAAMRDALNAREDVGSEAWYADMANAYEAEVDILRRDLAEARAALRRIRNLPPLYVRPSGGKDYHQCHFLATAPTGEASPHD